MQAGKIESIPIADIRTGPLRHGPFGRKRRIQIARIQKVFAEQMPDSFEVWEWGFRHDCHPDNEIRWWLSAADVYEEHTQGEADPARRREIYLAILENRSVVVVDLPRKGSSNP